MRVFNILSLGGLVLSASLMAQASFAATLGLEAAPEDTLQHSTTNPCIISDINCPHQPAGFAFTDPGSTGSTDSWDEFSPYYTVSQIIAAIGSSSFIVGLDVNQTNARSPQTLDLFEMYVDDSLVDSFIGDDDNVPALANGTGFGDYLLKGFTDLSAFDLASTVRFRAAMSGLNDGPEQLFLVAVPSQIPLPAAGFLLMGALGGMGLLARRRRLQR